MEDSILEKIDRELSKTREEDTREAEQEARPVKPRYEGRIPKIPQKRLELRTGEEERHEDLIEAGGNDSPGQEALRKTAEVRNSWDARVYRRDGAEDFFRTKNIQKAKRARKKAA